MKRIASLSLRRPRQPEQKGIASLNRGSRRVNDQEKELAWLSICAWRFLQRRSKPDPPLGIPDIFPIAAAIPARTNLICTRTVRANFLQTPMRAQFCRLFAGS